MQPARKKGCTGDAKPPRQTPRQVPLTEESIMEDIETWGQDTNSVGEDAKLSDISEFMKRVNAECCKDPATQLHIDQC